MNAQRLTQSLALLAAFVGGAAQAASENPGAPRRTVSAALYDVQGSVRGRFDMGVVNVNRSKITLNLPRAFHCPPGRMCAMVMPMPLVVEVPVVAVERDSCGATVYVGELNTLRQEGSVQTVRVKDYRSMDCRFLPESQTEVEYMVQHFNGEEQSLTMKGTRLGRGRADHLRVEPRFDCRRTPHVADLGLGLRLSDVSLVRGERVRKIGSFGTLTESGLMGIMSKTSFEVSEESRPGALSFSERVIGRVTLDMPLIRDPIEERPATLNAHIGEVSVQNQEMLCRTY